MGLFDKVEKNVGQGVSGFFSKFGKKDLKPADFVAALKEELDLKSVEVGHGQKVGPNQFKMILSTGDFDKIEGWGPQDFANELAGAVSEHGASEEYAFIGPINVIFEEDIEAELGDLQIVSEAVKSEVSETVNDEPKKVYTSLPQTDQTSLAETHPSIEVAGKRYVLTKDVTIIGRGNDCDIILDDTSVSRHHIEIKITPNGVIASDLGSANGMFVEQHNVPAATLLGGNTITIGRTNIIFWEPLNKAA